MPKVKKTYCEHNRNPYFCKECGGAGICSHGKQRAKCVPCGGSQICMHDRQKYRCKECGGKGVCIHEREKGRCKECKAILKANQKLAALLQKAEQQDTVEPMPEELPYSYMIMSSNAPSM